MKNISKLSLIIYLSLSLITIAAFWGVHNYEFINLDDSDYVVDNPHVQAGFTGETLRWAFFKSHASNWHPVTWLSHMLDCRIFGLNPGRHHLINLSIHILNVLLLFAILKNTTGSIWRSAFAACLFALHPLRVESVAWVAERKDVLSALFWMLTTLAYIRYCRRPGIIRYLPVLISFSLGLMSKPMLVTLPFVLLLMDYWPLERLRMNANETNLNSTLSKSQKYSLSHLIVEKAPLFVLAIVSSAITYFAQLKGGAMNAEDQLSILSRVADAFISYIIYIQKMFWPSALAPFYPPPVNGVSVVLAIAAAAALLIATVLTIRFGRHYKYLPVGWFWYLGTLVPVIGLVKVGAQAYADRYTYLPLIGLFILIAWLAPQLSAKWRFRQTALAVCSAIIIAALFICTYFQQQYWRNNFTLFGRAIAVTKDNYLAHFCIADPLRAEGRLKEAIYHNRESLRLRPAFYQALNSMGMALIEAKQYDEAIGYFKGAIKVKPNIYQPRLNLGIALIKKGSYDEAIAHYREALQKFDSPLMRMNLALALRSKGNTEEAIEEYKKVLAFEPSNALVHYTVGVILAEQEKYDDAASHLQKALETKSDFVEAHNSLGYVFAHQGKYDEAINQYNEALKSAPKSAELHINLGYVFVAQGNFDLAAAEYEKALEIEPNDYIAHTYLGTVLFRLGKSKEGLEHINQALKINPDYAIAKNTLEALKTLVHP